MTFGKGSSPVFLCSASADYIIVWEIELCQMRVKEGEERVCVWPYVDIGLIKFCIYFHMLYLVFYLLKCPNQHVSHTPPYDVLLV